MVAFVVPNITRDNALSITRKVLTQLTALGCTVYLDLEMKKSFSGFEKVLFLSAGEAAKVSDVVIAVGGDGSLIYASKYAVENKKPLLGVNAGNLAFMAGLEGDETHLLKRLLSEDYKLDKRILLAVELVDEKNIVKYSANCLNDAVILRGANLHSLKLTLFKNDEKLNDFNADGLIISTPTGSTAYSLSAGGPIVEPAVEAIIVTPICSHTMMSRSVVLRDDCKITVKIPFLGDGAILTCDSLESAKIKKGYSVIIKKADFTCNLIKIKENSFMDILLDKFAKRAL